MTYAEIQAEWIVLCAEAEYWLEELNHLLGEY